MDEEMASNVKLGLEVQGTTDEVDSSEIHPAPAPTAEDLQNTSVDVSSSQAIGTHKEPDFEHDQAVDDRIESLPLEQDTVDLSLPGPEEEGDVSLGYTDNAGSQSPATRTLELPPALDLSQSQGDSRSLTCMIVHIRASADIDFADLFRRSYTRYILRRCNGHT